MPFRQDLPKLGITTAKSSSLKAPALRSDAEAAQRGAQLPKRWNTGQPLRRGVNPACKIKGFVTGVGKRSSPFAVMVGEPAKAVPAMSSTDLIRRILTSRSLLPTAASAAVSRSRANSVFGQSSM